MPIYHCCGVAYHSWLALRQHKRACKSVHEAVTVDHIPFALHSRRQPLPSANETLSRNHNAITPNDNDIQVGDDYEARPGSDADVEMQDDLQEQDQEERLQHQNEAYGGSSDSDSGSDDSDSDFEQSTPQRRAYLRRIARENRAAWERATQSSSNQSNQAEQQRLQFLDALRRTCHNKHSTQPKCKVGVGIGDPGRIFRTTEPSKEYASMHAGRLGPDGVYDNDHDDDYALYHPFKSKYDFEVAFWLKRSNTSRNEANELIQILRVRTPSFINIFYLSFI